MTISAGTVSLAVRPEVEGFSTLMRSALQGETGAFQSMGKEIGGKLAAGIGASLAAVGALSVKYAMDMGVSDAKIQGNAQITAKRAAEIGDAFLKTAGQSTFSGKEMADSFAPVAGVIQSIAGHTLKQSEALLTMKAATTLAEASGKTLASTTADLASVMQGFGIKLSGASEAANILFNASRLTNVDLDTLSGTVVKLHGKLGLAAPTLTDISTLMVDLANHGVSGSKGLMVVNSAMGTLLGGSKATSSELANLGVKVWDSSGKFIGMKNVLAELTPKLAGMTDQQRLATLTVLMGKTAASALNSTIMAGADGYMKATAAVTAHNAAQMAAEAAANTLKGKMEKLHSSFDDIVTLIGEAVIPKIEAVVSWFGKHKVIAEVLAGIVGGALVAAMGAWTVSLFAAGGALAFVTWPIVAVTAGIAALVIGVKYAYDHFKIFHDVVDGVWEWLKSAIVETINFVKAHWDLIVGVILGPIALIAVEIVKHWDAITGIVSDAITAILDFVKIHWSLLVEIIAGPIGLVVVQIVKHWDAIKTATTDAIKDVVGFFAQMPGKIVEAVGDLSKLLLNIGSSIFTGLWDGMKSAWSHVAGWLSSVGSKIASLKGPLDYDRGLLIPHGNAIMDGLNEGLMTGFERVKLTLASIAGQMSSGFSSSLGVQVQGGIANTHVSAPKVPMLVTAPSSGSLDMTSSAVRATAVKSIATPHGALAAGDGATSADIADLKSVVASLAKSFDSSLANQSRLNQTLARAGL